MARKGNGYQTVAQLKKKGGSSSKAVLTPTYATYRPKGADYSASNGGSGDIRANANLIGRRVV